MKYVSFRHQAGSASFGRLDGDIITDLGVCARDLKTAIAAGPLDGYKNGTRCTLAEVTLLPVIPNPGKIFCVGLNYEAHRQETGRAKVEHPSIFTRWSDTLVAHGQSIVRPNVSRACSRCGCCLRPGPM